ncbi:extracellular solute-binding protein [Tengunoibacter tsumagoiensis]|uniref:Sugar ABC transporter substrate-binding protein n=1 Tax=Tengunoibacter tsumagoiensis TaxID=2014871 RepID=A0A402A6E9_9CHLR|nr:extracellular solute-binding protein [Tengunoibacter tsumagoiensis]GCE14606.1 sugar ABC transporter substrate-binding protein [Tengunoibacter tsumagoiensis]
MKQRLAPIFAVFTILAMLFLSACGGDTKSSGPVQLTFWYNEGKNEEAAVLKVVNDFNTSHPNIHVKAEYIDFNSEHDKFVTAAAGGSGAPDIIRIQPAWTSELAKKGFLLNLDGKIDGVDDFLPSVMSYGKYNGGLYSLPEVTDFLAMCYNKDLLQKAGIANPPTTFDELRADLKKLTNAQQNKYGFATSGGSWFVLPFIYAYGGDQISNDESKIYINQPASVTGFSSLVDILNKDKTAQPLDLTNGYNNMNTGFKNGDVAIIFQGPWQVTDLLTGPAFQGSNSGNFGVAPIPVASAGDVPRSPIGGQSHAIYAGTAHPAEALEFLNYFDSKDSLAAIAKANGTLPARQSAYTPEVLQNPVVKAFNPLISTGKNVPINPVSPQLNTPLDKDIQNALAGKQDPADALNQVATDWKPLINQ